MDDTTSPIIIVCSEGSQSTLDIINNIRKLPQNENIVNLCDDIIGYKYQNVTKYYENDIVFVSHVDKHINLIPVELRERIEGLIVYFDAEDKTFLQKLPIYGNFIDSNNIEFGLLLCKEFFDNPLDGITYKEAKSGNNAIDVIELNREHDNNRDDGNSGHHDPVGYDEILQAIRAIIWSNVNMKRKQGGLNACTTEQEINDDADGNDDNIEAELTNFEQLLSEVMMFKEATASWSRAERLAHAEKFAYAFDNLLQGGNKQTRKGDQRDNSSDSD